MGSRAAGCAARLVLVSGLIGSLSPATARAERPTLPLIELRVVTHDALGVDDRRLAREAAETVLASAGIRAVWRECDPVISACAQEAPGQCFVLVHLLPMAKKSAPSIAGDLSREVLTTLPVVLVYVRRAEQLSQAIRHSARGRTHPLLATVTMGHLVGVTIAHEVGHALGLRHTAYGVMKAQLGIDEIVALRSLRLAFLRGEGEQMRQALRAEGDLRAHAR